MTANDIEGVVTLLNSLLQTDPERISAFFMQSSLVDLAAADLPFEISPSPFERVGYIFPMGLINGIASEYDSEGNLARRIGIEFDESGEPLIKRFYVEAAGGSNQT